MFMKYKARVRIKTVRSDDKAYFMLWRRHLELLMEIKRSFKILMESQSS